MPASRAWRSGSSTTAASSTKVELDAPVQRYIPWFRVADPEASAQITVRHLLNQTSGLAERAGRGATLAAGMHRLEPAVRAHDAPVHGRRRALPLLREFGVLAAIAVVPTAVFKVNWKGLFLYGPGMSYALAGIGGPSALTGLLRVIKAGRSSGRLVTPAAGCHALRAGGGRRRRVPVRRSPARARPGPVPAAESTGP